MFRFKIKQQIGQTLLEVIIALAVITTGVVSSLSLTSYNLTTVFSSETRLIAANLAREGIEAARQLRDSNWLAGNPWNQGIVDAGKYRLTVNFDPSANAWTTQSQAVDIGACANCQLYLAGSGVYSHNAAGNTATAYKRLITLKQICWQDVSGSEVVMAVGQNCGANPLIGYQVESLLAWTEAGRAHQLSVIDRLYDWK
ncbi:MAG: hypothetical protein NTZ18_03050 [Candidatus Komeilibacteria bacterium]|nr:hypothetical protein [Candidatus Komeilibacteria bacterium]